MKKAISSILACTIALGSVGSFSCFAKDSSVVLKGATTVAEEAIMQVEEDSSPDESKQEDLSIDIDEEDEDISSEEGTAVEDEDANGKSGVSYLKVAGYTAGLAAAAAAVYFGYNNQKEISDFSVNAYENYISPAAGTAWNDYISPNAKSAWTTTSKYSKETAYPAIEKFVTETIPTVSKSVWDSSSGGTIVAANFSYKHAVKFLGIIWASLLSSKAIFCSEGNYPGVCDTVNSASSFFTGANATIVAPPVAAPTAASTVIADVVKEIPGTVGTLS